MTKNTFLVYVLCALALCFMLFASEVLAFGNRQMKECRPQPISVSNSSTKWVRIIGLRWLNDDETSWVLRPMNNQIIRKNEHWSTLLTPWGIHGPEAYYQAKYQTLDDEDKMQWSEAKTTSQVRVADCQAPEPITIKIVDMR